MNPANFSFHDWEQRTDAKIYSVPALNERNLPPPPDRYAPGHLSWGKNVDRGLSIQRGRGRKRLEANKAAFLANVLPLIQSELNPAAWKELAQAFDDRSLYARGGFTRYVLGDKAAWVHHSESEKLAHVAAIGALAEGALH